METVICQYCKKAFKPRGLKTHQRSCCSMKLQLNKKWSELEQLVATRKVKHSLEYKHATVEKIQKMINKIEAFFREREAVAIAEITVKLLAINKIRGDDTKILAEKIQQVVKDIPINAVIKIEGRVFQHTNESRTIHKLILALPYDDDDEAERRLHTLSYSVESVNPTQVQQAFRLGEINCVLGPLKQQLLEKMESVQTKSTKKYYQAAINKIKMLEPEFEQNGGTPELLQRLANIASFKLKFTEPLSGNIQKYKTEKVPKARWQFEFINIRLNHVELWQSKKDIDVRPIAKDDLNTMAIDQINQRNSFTFAMADDINYKWIKQGNTKFMEQSAFDYRLIEQEMRQYTNDLKIKLTNDQFKLLKQFCNVSGNLLFQNYNQDDIEHIDIAKGYSICAQISKKYRQEGLDEKYNLGIPYITQLRKCDKEFALQYNGLYICQIDFQSAPEYVRMLQDEREYQFLNTAILRFLNDNKIQFVVIGGFYGHASKHLVYEDQWIDSKAYFKFPSKCIICDNDQTKIITPCHIGSNEMASIIARQVGVIRAKHESNTFYIQTDIKEKQYTDTLIHYGASVLLYQQLAMMLQLKDMNPEKIIGIIGDDIYYRKHEYKRKPYFTIKDTNKCDAICWSWSHFINNPHSHDRLDLEVLGEKRNYYKTQLLLGQGGYGKSHSVLQDKGNIGIIYLTLTNDLVNDQRQHHGCKASTKDLFISKTENHQIKCNPSVIVIDELGLTGSGIIHYAKKKYQNAMIYCLGDPLQLQNNLEDQYNPELYEMVYGEECFTTDWRSKDIELTKLKNKIRRWMRLGVQERDIYYKLTQRLNTIKKPDIPKSYNSAKDIIVTHSNSNKDSYTQLLRDKQSKYRVTKYFRNNDQDYFTGQILTNVNFQHKNLNLQHAFTCHSLQGQTHSGGMFITRPINHEMFKGYVYTAVSRCQYLNQIHMVVD